MTAGGSPRIALWAMVVIGLAACDRAPVTTCVIGDSSARVQAHVPIELAGVHFDAADMRVGLGTAAIGGWESLGDAAAVGGNVWVRSTNARSPRYFAALHNRYFQTSAFVYVPRDTQPAATLALEEGSVDALWTELAARYPQGVVAAGYVHVARLQLIAIARPPVKAVPIMGNAQHYYTRPMETKSEAWVYLIGIAGRPPGDPSSLLARALPALPGKRDGYAHALLLQGPPADVRTMPTAADVRQVGEVVRGSMIAGGALSLYPVVRLGDCAADST